MEITRMLPRIKTGVYRIRNLINGKVYVGSAAKSFLERWGEHRRALREGRHHSVLLQRSWIKHGEGAFVFEVVEPCNPIWAVAQEQVFIDLWKSADRKYGYNIYKTAGSPLGTKRSMASRLKQSLTTKGRVFSEEHRAKISASKIGKKRSLETRNKISRTKRENGCSGESRKRMSDAQKARFSRESAVELKKKSSKRMMLLNNSEEFRKVRSEAHKKYWQSQDARIKQSEKMKSQLADPEFQAKRAFASNASRHKKPIVEL